MLMWTVVMLHDIFFGSFAKAIDQFGKAQSDKISGHTGCELLRKFSQKTPLNFA